jgi:hypothetical protein
MSTGAAAGAAAAAARINATRSFGVIVTVEPEDFLTLAALQKEPLVVRSIGGVFAREYRYLMSFKGLAFFTKSSGQLEFAPGTLVIQSQKIYLPG